MFLQMLHNRCFVRDNAFFLHDGSLHRNGNLNQYISIQHSKTIATSQRSGKEVEAMRPASTLTPSQKNTERKLINITRACTSKH